MSLRIRFQHSTGATLGYTIERLADGFFYDTSNATFTLTPVTPMASLPEDAGIYLGRYKVTLTPTPFADGDYVITVIDKVANLVAGQLSCLMHAGDDATVIPLTSNGPDPWTIGLPGAYAAGTAGAILGLNLDAKISTRSTYAGTAPTVVQIRQEIDANSTQLASLVATQAALPASVWGAPSRGLTSGVTVIGYATGMDPATQVLFSPTHKLAADGSGNVAANNLPIDYAQRTFAPAWYTAPDNADVMTMLNGLSFVQASVGSNVGALEASVKVVTDKLATALQSDGGTGYQFTGLALAHAPNVVASDPWATLISGGYAAGTAGAILGQNLDAKISTRSTYAGGAVASVAAPVTVGVNNDKSGYTLSGSGLDAIVVEAGINARQALSPLLAASAGVLTGAGTGAIVIRGANSATSRIIATTDNAGNRTSVTLSLPT